MRALVFLGLLACGPKAPPASPVTEAATTASPDASGPRDMFVWKAVRDGQTNYLVGTCHVGVPLETVLPPETHGHVLGEARVLLTEVDMSTMDPMQMVGALTDGAADRSLLALMDEDAFWRMAQSLPSIPVSMVARMPAFLGGATVTMMASGPERFAALFDGPPLDRAVVAAAEANGRTTFRDLETAEAQLAMVGEFDADIAAELSDPEALNRNIIELGATLESCFRQDRATLEAGYAEAGESALNDRLLEQRNRSWMPVLLEEFAAGGAVAAVGAAHMVGPAGLVTLLADEGFTVTPETTTVPLPPARDIDWSTPVDLLDAPVSDPDKAAQWVAVLSQTAGVMCQSPPMKTCFAPDTDQCVATLSADAALCVRQHLPNLPDAGSMLEDPTGMQQAVMALAPCVGAGVALDGMANLPTDVPMCAEIAEQMKSAGQ